MRVTAQLAVTSQINAGKNHEVRWINKRSQPIAVIFPRSDESRLSCRKGFKDIGGVLSAEIAPNASASMCFAELGKYDYRVRLDENQPAAETDRNASVWVVARGERIIRKHHALTPTSARAAVTRHRRTCTIDQLA